jgi:hypothetical protein
VTQATWLKHPERSDIFAPEPSTRLAQAQSGQTSSTWSFFDDPFGDDAQPPPAASAQQPQAELMLPPPGEREVDPALPPGESQPMNELRNAFDELEAPAPRESQAPAPRESEAPPRESEAAPEPAPTRSTPKSTQSQDTLPDAPPAKESTLPKLGEPSLEDLLRDNRPDNPQRSEKTDDSLQDRSMDPSVDDPFDNPFERRDRADRLDRDRLNSDAAGDAEDRAEGMGRYSEDADFRRTTKLSCEDFRKRLAELTIDQVSLDISPPYRPDEFDESRYGKLKADFDENQVIREWRSLDGSKLASGRLRDLAYEKAVIETEFGTTEELPINRLSEADIAYITENWGLPQECLIEQVAYTPRNWTPATMTWKASNLCHHPLYFEDVNLERYGHTRGPLLEPIVQTAHFFGSVIVLPYKMGVHPPNECQYALGYYRPGNCAPWICPPVPLSARGAIAQAATMTGLFWLIP